MNEDFVTYEIAKKLKEKGFKEKCIAYYWENIDEHTPSFVVEDNMPEDGLCLLDLLSNHNQAEWSPFIDTPTISQVLKWLREKKRIDAGAVWDNRDGKWVGYVNEMDMPDLVGEYVLPDTYASYEQAALAGVNYCLENLI